MGGEREVLRDIVEARAKIAGVPADLAVGLVRHESGFDKWALGRAGEIGLGQIKCSTAREMGFSGRCGLLYNVGTNITYTLAYLKKALRLAKGNRCKALSKYNAGLAFKGLRKEYCKKVMG